MGCILVRDLNPDLLFLIKSVHFHDRLTHHKLASQMVELLRHVSVSDLNQKFRSFLKRKMVRKGNSNIFTILMAHTVDGKTLVNVSFSSHYWFLGWSRDAILD